MKGCNKRCSRGKLLNGRTNKCVNRKTNKDLAKCQQNKITNVMREFKEGPQLFSCLFIILINY